MAQEPGADESDALLLRLRGGDGQAFELMVRRQTPRLLAVTRRMLGNEEDARDAVQEAFFKAFRSLHSFEGNCQLSTWLHRIAVNTSLMRLRSRRRRPEGSIEDLLPRFLEDGHHAAKVEDWSADALALVARREESDFVRGCIDKLPESHRTVLILRDIEELDTEETAQLLGATANAVKVRLHRARQALRSQLERRFGKAAEGATG